MGLDWIPCRVEPHVENEFVQEAVQQEYERFISQSGYVPSQLLPLISRDPFIEFEPNENVDVPATRITDLLLMKYWNSHRVYVISDLEVLPLEWRLRAHRTILPDELGGSFTKWKNYLDAVKQGAYRGYLEEVLLYVSTIEVGLIVAQELRAAEQSKETSASWATRPETCVVRDEILNFPEPTILKAPQLDIEMARNSDIDDRFSLLRDYRSRFCDLVDQWNNATRRGNWRFEYPPAIPDLELWITKWLEHERFSKFSEWLVPWINGGYGLYRDCE